VKAAEKFAPQPPKDCCCEQLQTQVQRLQLQVNELQLQVRKQEDMLADHKSVVEERDALLSAVKDRSSKGTETSLVGSSSNSTPSASTFLPTALSQLIENGVDMRELKEPQLKAMAQYTANVVQHCVTEYARHYENNNFWRLQCMGTQMPIAHGQLEQRISSMEHHLSHLEQRRGRMGV
jgi:hypothetical protein